MIDLAVVAGGNGSWLGSRGAGAVLELVRGAPAITRAELVERTGLSRSTVSQRLDQLMARGLITDAEGASTGGRRPSLFAFNPRGGVVLAAGLGATHARLAVTDLAGALLAVRADEIDITVGPDIVLGWVEEQFAELLTESATDIRQVRGVGVAIPAPVEAATGKPVLPPLMPTWDGYSIPDRLSRRYAVPVYVDNDVNVMALGEQRTHYRDVANLLFLKVGTGIGAGIVADDHVQRGADGSAGDIGHVHTIAGGDVLCRCGKFGCLEAIASGGAIARRMREQGADVTLPRHVVARVREGDMLAIELVRESGRLIGEAVAGAVNLLNPRVIVVGGEMAHAEDHLLPGIRELVYQRSISLATRQLRIVRSRLDDRAEVTGAAMMVIDQILAAPKIDEIVAA